jgi:hypothetical protein
VARSAADDRVDILHLYGQTQWHSPAAISGSRHGLELLRAAIDDALTKGSGCASVMTDDGEGYTLVVMREGPDTMRTWTEDDLDRGLPYSDDIASCPPEASFWKRVDEIARRR